MVACAPIPYRVVKRCVWPSLGCVHVSWGRRIRSAPHVTHTRTAPAGAPSSTEAPVAKGLKISGHSPTKRGPQIDQSRHDVSSGSPSNKKVGSDAMASPPRCIERRGPRAASGGCLCLSAWSGRRHVPLGSRWRRVRRRTSRSTHGKAARWPDAERRLSHQQPLLSGGSSQTSASAGGSEDERRLSPASAQRSIGRR